MSAQPRIGVVGATGAVGTVTLALLAERGYENVRAFASVRSAGSRLAFGDEELVVEEATAEVLGAGDVDLFLFSVGTSASLQLVPVASGAGAICVDKSSAYRLVDGYPLVVPEVNGRRALESLERDRIVANPNCCTIPLTCVLKPLHDEAGLRRVRVATYQSVSGAGAQRMDALAGEAPADHDLVMDWSWEDGESDEEAKLRAETRKIMELPELPVSATPRPSGSSSRRRSRPRMRPSCSAAPRASAFSTFLPSRRLPPRRGSTTCSSAASAETTPRRTASRSTSRATISARAPR
jgi:aspartate-semialdehyde dehydrogenase